MSDPLARQAGSALGWKVVQLAGSQGIQLLRVLILARLLVPEEFGLLAIALVTIRTMMAVTDVGMLQALVQRPDCGEESYDAGWTVGVLRGLGIALLVAAGSPLIAAAFGEPRVTPILLALAAKPALDSLASIEVARLTRELRFRPLALIGVATALVDTVVAVALAPSLGVWALVAGLLAGSLAHVAVSYAVAPHRPRLLFGRRLAAPLVRYGRWILLTGIVGIAGSTLLQLVISRALGVAALGLYYMALRLITFPTAIAGQVVGAVAFPVFSRLQDRPAKAALAFREILSGSTVMLVPVYTVLIAFAPSLVTHLLGEGWAGSATVLRLLALAGIIGILGDVAVPLLNGLGRPERTTLLEATQSFLLVTGAALLTGRYGLDGAAAAWIPATAATQLLALFFISRLLPRPFAGLVPRTLTIVATAAAGAALGWLILRALGGPIGTLGAVAVALAVTLGGTWALDRGLGLGLAEGLSRVFPPAARLLGCAERPAEVR